MTRRLTREVRPGRPVDSVSEAGGTALEEVVLAVELRHRNDPARPVRSRQTTRAWQTGPLVSVDRCMNDVLRLVYPAGFSTWLASSRLPP
jgi:hypothetical protein